MEANHADLNEEIPLIADVVQVTKFIFGFPQKSAGVYLFCTFSYGNWKSRDVLLILLSRCTMSAGLQSRGLNCEPSEKSMNG